MTDSSAVYQATVARIRRVDGAGTWIDLAVPPPFPSPRAGQFVQIACCPEDPFRLHRPFGICRWQKTLAGAEIGILFSVVGEGTRWLDARRPGEEIRLLGPLGQPFWIVPGRTPILVAGGRGVAPLLLLADQIASEYPEGLLLYGAEDAAALFPTEESPYLVHRSTLDGSAGQPGTVIDLLQGLFRRGAFRSDLAALCGCGPLRMLEALSRFAMDKGIPVQVSMETMFGCGTGLCAGCAVPMRPQPGEGTEGFDRYAFACTDGPVFDGSRIDWSEVCA